MSREFEIRRETILEATPQQAWDAINTGAGLASWLFPAGEGAPSGEGDVWAGHRVLAWDPPRHSHVRMDGEDGFYNSLENTIEDRGDGTLLLRYVHSGVIVDDWDTQYDGAAQHTDFYQHSMAEYLRHFAGRHAVYVGAEGPAAFPSLERSGRCGGRLASARERRSVTASTSRSRGWRRSTVSSTT
jgi:uncharacterized protein YndB with AHSA1/START domain